MHPWEYELELDEGGWVPVEQLLFSLRENKKWADIQEEQLVKMITLSKKKRHIIENGKIRAHYGHSIPTRIIKREQVPPELLPIAADVCGNMIMMSVAEKDYGKVCFGNHEMEDLETGYILKCRKPVHSILFNYKLSNKGACKARNDFLQHFLKPTCIISVKGL